MQRTSKPKPAEFRHHIIALAQLVRTAKSLARGFEPGVATIHLWIKEAKADAGPDESSITSDEREGLCRLQCENKVLRQACDVLSKAAARPKRIVAVQRP